MNKLLHLSASPRRERSESLALADTFLAAFQEANRHVDIEHWDLWDGTLPAFGPAAVEAKMAVFAGADPDGDAAAAWTATRAAFDRFDSADAYLFSVPMWNHSVPYILKQFIDVVSQPGMVFGFDPVDGYKGLLKGKRAVVIHTGAVWGPDRSSAFGNDFLTPYFEDWLRWIGITDITTLLFQPNLAASDVDERRVLAHQQAEAMGYRFAELRAA